MLKKKFRERKKEGVLKTASKEIGESILGEVVEAVIFGIFQGILRVIKHLF